MERLGAVSVELAQLPPGFVFSHNLTENIHYDKEEKRLVFRGAMAEDEKDELQKLSDEPQYEEAVEKLFQKSQSLPEYIVRHDWREKTLEWVEYIFFGLTCGYGVRPWRPIGVAGSLILIFTIVYLLGYYLSKTYERLERLPKGLKFPDSLTGKLKGKIHYDAEKERLTFRGLMSRKEQDGLLRLSQGKKYQEAVKELFQNSGPLRFPRGERHHMEEKWYHKLLNSIYASVITFATLGLGGIIPSGGFKIAVIIEGVLGWLTMALFLVTLANVWLR
jgi:hypothetical protein